MFESRVGEWGVLKIVGYWKGEMKFLICSWIYLCARHMWKFGQNPSHSVRAVFGPLLEHVVTEVAA